MSLHPTNPVCLSVYVAAKTGKVVNDFNFHKIFVIVIKVLQPHQLNVANLRLQPLKPLIELPIQSFLAVFANHLKVVFRHSFEELKVL